MVTSIDFSFIILLQYVECRHKKKKFWNLLVLWFLYLLVCLRRWTECVHKSIWNVHYVLHLFFHYVFIYKNVSLNPLKTCHIIILMCIAWQKLTKIEKNSILHYPHTHTMCRYIKTSRIKNILETMSNV